MIITVDNVNKTYKNGSLELQVLKNISFKVDKGEFLAIMGSSGSGKSTMMNILGCLDNQYEGKYILDGIDISKSTENELSEIRNKKIGFIFQSFNLFPNMSVIENIKLSPKKVLKISDKEATKDAKKLLSDVGLIDKLNASPNSLSGGQKQRVAIARALAMKPKIMLFDEPTSALDPEMIGEVLEVIKSVAAKGMTMIIVTHEMKFAREVATRILFLHKGEIIEDGTPSQVMDHPKTERARQFFSKSK